MRWSRGIHRSAAAVNITIPGYKIEHLIAEGGTSSVYLAVQESLRRHVAIKLLRKFDNPEQLTRFLNEGQIIASLNHRNIINIHDICHLSFGIVVKSISRYSVDRHKQINSQIFGFFQER